MNNNKRVRRGLSSVLAMIYLSLLAALAVGFYTAVDMSGNLADNEQYISRSQTSAESGLAFARAQIAQLSLPNTTTPANLLANTTTALGNQLSSWGAGNVPNVVTFTAPGNTTGQAIAIPQQAAGWSWSGSGALPAGTKFMTTDGTGGQTLLLVTEVGTSTNLQVRSVGENSNARVTPITRALQLNFTSAQGAQVFNPVFNYGMVSYGEVVMNGAVTVKGATATTPVSVMSVVASGTNPFQMNATGSGVSGSFYWTNNTSENSITWDSARDDTSNGLGYLPSQGNYSKYAVGDESTPTAPTFETSSFATNVTSQSPGSGTTTLTNADLAAGTYIFSQPVTINGVLYLENDVHLIFNNSVTVHGSIVEADNTTAGAVNTPNNTIIFNNNASLTGQVQQSSTVAYPATSSTPFLLVPNAEVIFNEPVTTIGPIVGGGLTFNSTATINGGPVIDTGTILTGSTSNPTPMPLTFNAAATIKDVNAAGTGFTGAQQIQGNFTFSTTASSYVEVGQ